MANEGKMSLMELVSRLNDKQGIRIEENKTVYLNELGQLLLETRYLTNCSLQICNEDLAIYTINRLLREKVQFD